MASTPSTELTLSSTFFSSLSIYAHTLNSTCKCHLLLRAIMFSTVLSSPSHHRLLLCVVVFSSAQTLFAPLSSSWGVLLYVVSSSTQIEGHSLHRHLHVVFSFVVVLSSSSPYVLMLSSAMIATIVYFYTIMSKFCELVFKHIKEESNNDDSNDRDYELSMITIKIKRMWKSMNSSRFNYFSKRSFHKKEESPVICSKCKKPRHFKSECPDLEKSKDKKKKFFKSKKKTS
ncbi:hypothetical protein JHK85_034485 [Glycine max]|nr:hypothetical protein JHK85_034485 [Glycine max]